MYLKRHIEKVVAEAAETFKTVLVTGARQVGKSWLFENSVAKDIPQITLDDFAVLAAVKRDVQGFLNENPPPVFIDEIQYAPELFRGIKMVVDKRKLDNGLYFMTGSQKFELMQNVSESLAGRIAILNLLGLSTRELNGDGFNLPFIPVPEYLQKRKPVKQKEITALWKSIHRGFFPQIALQPSVDWARFYAAYLKTYIERDVQKLSQIGDNIAFVSFMTALAARTGQLLNVASIARDIGISEPTVKKWISVLQASNIIYLMRPFSLNISSRVVKTPKIYFLDTGLAAYLCGWLTSETLQKGAMSGQIFETYVVGEILKSYYNAGIEPSIFFFRNSKAEEIDILFYTDGTLYPVEIKKTASPNPGDVSSFKRLETAFPSVTIGGGGLICTYDKVLPLTEKVKIIPVNYL